jgi:hypothetical protein
MKVVYKPFSLFTRQIATRVGNTAFGAIWARVADSERPPKATAGHRSLVAVAGAAALEAATMAAVAAVADQLTARAFHHLLGAWPEKPPEA